VLVTAPSAPLSGAPPTPRLVDGDEQATDAPTTERTSHRTEFGIMDAHTALFVSRGIVVSSGDELWRHFRDRLVADHVAGKKVLKETCMSKGWHSEMLQS
jgi:hypothetical protein